MSKQKPEPKPEPKSDIELREEVVLESSKAVRAALAEVQEKDELSPMEVIAILAQMVAEMADLEKARQYEEYLGDD